MGKNSAPVSSRTSASARPGYSFISAESPAEVKEGGWPLREDSEEACEQSFSATLDLFGQFSAADAESVAVPATRASAHLVCFQWLGRINSVLKQWGSPPAQPYPERARFKFGNDRLGDARVAPDIPPEAAGLRG